MTDKTSYFFSYCIENSPPPHSTSQFLFYFFLNNSEASNIENLSEIIKQGVLKSTNHWNDHSVMNANRCQIARFFSAYAFLLILYEIHITAGQGFVIIFACINFFRKGIAKIFFFPIACTNHFKSSG